MNPRRSPGRVRPRHPSDEGADLGIDAWPSTSPSAPPAPVFAESGPVPPDHRSRLDHEQRCAPAAPPSRHEHPEGAVGVAQPRTLHGALEHAELLSQSQGLEHEIAAAAKGAEQGSTSAQRTFSTAPGASSSRQRRSTISRRTASSGGTSGCQCAQRPPCRPRRREPDMTGVAPWIGARSFTSRSQRMDRRIQPCQRRGGSRP